MWTLWSKSILKKIVINGFQTNLACLMLVIFLANDRDINVLTSACTVYLKSNTNTYYKRCLNFKQTLETTFDLFFLKERILLYMYTCIFMRTSWVRNNFFLWLEKGNILVNTNVSDFCQVRLFKKNFLKKVRT